MREVQLLQGEEVVAEARQVEPRAPCFDAGGQIRPARSFETCAYTKHAHTHSQFVCCCCFYCRKIRKDTRFTHCSYLPVKQERTHESRIVGSKRPFSGSETRKDTRNFFW